MLSLRYFEFLYLFKRIVLTFNNGQVFNIFFNYVCRVRNLDFPFLFTLGLGFCSTRQIRDLNISLIAKLMTVYRFLSMPFDLTFLNWILLLLFFSCKFAAALYQPTTHNTQNSTIGSLLHELENNLRACLRMCMCWSSWKSRVIFGEFC